MIQNAPYRFIVLQEFYTSDVPEIFNPTKPAQFLRGYVFVKDLKYKGSTSYDLMVSETEPPQYIMIQDKNVFYVLNRLVEEKKILLF